MAKPIILTVDDDPMVLKTVASDLQKKYGKEHQIVPINLGTAALDYLQQVHQQDREVALLLVDQRMPQMTGVAFLKAARQFYPDAKKVLLTAYADIEAAITAINEVRLDYYLQKPWDPPEERLYPILDQLLAEWKGSNAA